MSAESIPESIPVHLYRQVISSVLTIRKSSNEADTHEPLLQLVKEVFEYKKDRHESILSRERKRTMSCDLSIGIVEAKDCSLQAATQPYCVIRVENEPTPSTSPFQRRRNSSVSDSDNLLTQCVVTSKLVWDGDQRYKLNVSDPATQQLIIYILPADNTVTPIMVYSPSPRGSVISLLTDAQAGLSSGSPEKSSGFRNFFDWFKSPDKKEKYRTTVIQMKDIISPKFAPKTDWFPITYRGRPDGSLRIQLGLIPYQRSVEESDLPECDENVSIGDLIEVVRHFHTHAAKLEKAANRRFYSGDLEGCHQQSFTVIKEFCSSNDLSDKDLWIINFGILLGCWYKDSPLPLSPESLNQASFKIVSEPTEPCAVVILDTEGREVQERNGSHEALDFLFNAAKQFLGKTVALLVSSKSFVPPNAERPLPDDIFHSIQVLKELWQWFDLAGSKHDLKAIWKAQVVEELEAAYAQWVRQELSEKFQETSSDSLDAIVDFLEKIQYLIQRKLQRVQMCFRSNDIDYLYHMIRGIDKQLPYYVKLMILESDSLLPGTTFESVERERLCRQSIKLYMSLKNFVTFISDNFIISPSSDLIIGAYQSWFTTCLSFWLQMWQKKSHGYILNALRNDLKLQNVEGLRITEGAHLILDVLVSGICEEFKNLQLSSPDQLLMGTIKIAEIFCDAIVAYSNHTYKRLLANEKSFAKRKSSLQIFYAVCSLDHLGREAKMKLPSHLKVKDLMTTLSTDYPDAIIHQSKATFERLTNYAFKVAQSLAVSLTKLVVAKMEPRIRKIVEEIANADEHLSHKMQILMRLKQSPCQEYMYYLDKVLSSYFFAFGEPFKEIAAKDLKELTLKLLTENLKIGMPPDYYEKMLVQIENLNVHFRAKGICYSPREMKFQFFLYELRQNSKSSTSLILEYFAALADGGDMTPGCYIDRGQLTIKAGHIRLTGEEVLIVVKVIRARNVSTICGKLGISNPFVRVEIAPFCMFPKSRWPFQTTRCATDRLNPEFDRNEKFEFTVPLTSFFTHGAVLGLTVWSFEFGANELAGEVFVHLARLPEISSELEVEELPEQTYSILQNRQTHTSAVFQILSDRMKWDPMAKKLVTQRKKLRRRMLRSRLLRIRSGTNISACLPIASCL